MHSDEGLTLEILVCACFMVANLPYWHWGWLFYFSVSLTHQYTTHFLSKLNPLLLFCRFCFFLPLTSQLNQSLTRKVTETPDLAMILISIRFFLLISVVGLPSLNSCVMRIKVNKPLGASSLNMNSELLLYEMCVDKKGELTAWSPKMKSLDMWTTSPHHCYKKCMRARKEN